VGLPHLSIGCKRADDLRRPTGGLDGRSATRAGKRLGFGHGGKAAPIAGAREGKKLREMPPAWRALRKAAGAPSWAGCWKAFREVVAVDVNDCFNGQDPEYEDQYLYDPDYDPDPM
jgi:hypothetical protein